MTAVAVLFSFASAAPAFALTPFFSNVSSTPVGYQQALGRLAQTVPGTCPTGQYQYNSFTFSTSTQNVTVSEFRSDQTTYHSSGSVSDFVQAVGLRITNQDTGIVYNTVNFVYPTSVGADRWLFGSSSGSQPYAAAGQTLLFEFTDPSQLPAPGAVGEFTQVRIPTVVAGGSEEIDNFTENREGCTPFPLVSGTYGVPAFSLFGETDTNITIPDLSATSTSITAHCPDFGLFTPLCDGILWFVVPNTTLISTQANATKGLIASKFPFSYVASLNTAMSSASQAATGTAPLMTIDLHDTVPTTTGLGDFMPSTITMFSATTVRTYVPDGAWNGLRALMTIAVYFGTAEMVYFGALALMKKDD